MKYNLSSVTSSTESNLIVLPVFNDKDSLKFSSAWDKTLKEFFQSLPLCENFKANSGQNVFFNSIDGAHFLALGLGDKSKFKLENLRREMATLASSQKSKLKSMTLNLESLKAGNLESTLSAIIEGIELSLYHFDKHLSKKSETKLKVVNLDTKEKTTSVKKLHKTLENTLHITESISVARDFVNSPPNVLNSETYAKAVKKDVSKIKNVSVKVHGKKELQKMGAGLFLSVNAGSAFEPQMVHLTYTPKKMTKKTKHITLVGKGLTFDTGGYSLKPGGSMVNMKFDMAGSATVFGAFRAAALLELPVKVTCILGMTDNAVNEHATMPDSIVKGRNGKTVEILNTDAEGRLVLADCLDYACDLKPDAIIDAATLTGACLIAVGSETCAVMGNDDKLVGSLLKSARNSSEYMWQLPIIPEFHEDMKSPIADLKNIGGSRFGGTAKAAAFLENFIKDDISWAHLDIAGIGDSQGHLPYCPKKGASGLIVRSLVDYLKNA
ncbi:MAG: leucyl aminopeptidase [Halobacteriovoraceae bacterium]|nr:leucyl aminopeptidase [Halobacteriovoraceae bacterium]